MLQGPAAPRQRLPRRRGRAAPRRARAVGGAALPAPVPADSAIDKYGQGGAVTELEGEIARLLGKPAAVFLPSGTMAQQAVLRVHAEQRRRRTIVFHPACHT